MVDHFRDAGDVGGDDWDLVGHGLADDHRSDLVRRGEQEHVGVLVVRVDVLSDIVQLNRGVLPDDLLQSVDVVDLVLTNVPGADDHQTNVGFPHRELLEQLHRPDLVLARADDSDREEGEWQLGAPLGVALRVDQRRWWHSNVDHLGGRGRLVELLLSLANVDHLSGLLQRLLHHRQSQVAVSNLEVLYDHLISPPGEYSYSGVKWIRFSPTTRG